jgi:hypothetical protein
MPYGKVDYAKINNWLSERNLSLAEDFVTAFCRHAKAYKKNRAKTP